jgi:ribose transport system substrate-binding protein
MGERKWTISLILLFVLFLYVLIHFVINTIHIEKTVQDLEDRKIVTKNKSHFIFISQEYDNPYWRKVEQGADDAADRLGVSLEYVGPFRTSAEEQIKLLEKAIASQVDGIIVQSLDEKTFTPVINKAISQHIPVITIDTDAPKSNRIAYVGTDNYAAGEQLGKTVAKFTKGSGKIGVIIGSDSSESQQMRLNGFLTIIKKYPKLHVVDILPSNISKIQATLQSESMLRNYKDISIMVGTSALDAVGILNATKNLHENKIKIFGFDDLEETLQAVSNQSIQATIIQKPNEMGFQSVRLLVDSLQGRGINKENFTPTEVVTKKNVYQEEKR